MLSLLIYGVMVIGLAAAAIVMSFLLGWPRHNPHKDMPYESGIAPTGSSRICMSVPYYVVAIMFIMFDVEILFLYPWAVSLQELGWKGFAVAGIFMIFVAEGLVYVWARGGLNWRHLSTTASARTSSSQD